MPPTGRHFFCLRISSALAALANAGINANAFKKFRDIPTASSVQREDACMTSLAKK
jgi:hypothetical protein